MNANEEIIRIRQKAKLLSTYGMKWCYDCKNFYYDRFCGYNACNCKIYGSLDVGQKERHPDVSAMTCPNYNQKDELRWFEKEN